MMKNKTLKGACLAAGLATSWIAAPIASAQSVSVHLTITDSTPLDDAYFLYNVTGLSPFSTVSLGDIAAPGGTFNFSIPTEGVSPPTIDPWDIVGSYAPNAITFGFINPSIAVGNTYASVLGLFDTEPDDYTSLLGGDSNDWTDFVVDANNDGGNAPGETVTLVNFSNGTEVGTATATLPEPMSASVLCLGGTILMGRRRRRVAG